MKIENRIDELIKAGWKVLESDFDTAAFQQWRLKAFECVDAMFGSDHDYTKYFRDCVHQTGATTLPVEADPVAGIENYWRSKELQRADQLDGQDELQI